jgi:hypothetical protein
MNATTQLPTVLPTLGLVLVALMPFAIIIGLLRLADRIAERRDARYARQIELTDAIHREFGAIVAPNVRRRRGGGWLISVAVPLAHRGAIPAILRITDEQFGAHAREGHASYEVVLTRPELDAQPEARHAGPASAQRPSRLAA